MYRDIEYIWITKRHENKNWKDIKDIDRQKEKILRPKKVGGKRKVFKTVKQMM